MIKIRDGVYAFTHKPPSRRQIMDICMTGQEWYGHAVMTTTIDGYTVVPLEEFLSYNNRMIQRIKVLEQLIKDLQQEKREEKNPKQLELTEVE